MKQKIVIKVDIHCDKCRKKALQIAAKQDGVSSVALEGPEKDKVVVIGEAVDAASLTICLGKKLHHASLERVEEVKPKPPEPPKPQLICQICKSISCATPNFCISSCPPKPQLICQICKSISCATPNFCISSCPPMPMYTVVPSDSYGPNCIIM